VFAGLTFGKYQIYLLLTYSFLTLFIGSLFGANLFNNVSPKLILLFALVLDGVFSWAFTTSTNYVFLVVCRFLTGFA
jgi:predicted MFS family arabinose efflux permease